MSNILVKFPTRSRPDKFFETLGMYMDRESGLHQVNYLVSCDLNDPSMNNDEVKDRLSAMDRVKFRFGNNDSKIAACNADMDIAPPGWQMLILASDDMIPQVDGWDNRISEEMQGRDAVWFFDGYIRTICTLSIMSRAIYERQGYIYHPDYKSLWCDNEWTDVAQPTFVEQVIIQHQHPINHKTPVDALLKYNESLGKQDGKTYKARKNLGFPGSSGGTDASQMLMSICICSLEPRSYMLSDLTASLYRQIDEANLRGKVEVLIEVDNGQIPIGTKRNLLVNRARGKYVCFVDDDDCVSDRYVELLAAACREGLDCVGITGRIREGNGWKRWVHSTQFKGCKDDGDEYTRPPNHLNPVKRSILVDFPFKNVNFGEDRDVALRMAKACSLQSETTVEDCVYDYYPHGCAHDARIFTPRAPQNAKVPKHMHAKVPKNMQKRMDAAAK